jgi:hypothetical protein
MTVRRPEEARVSELTQRVSSGYAELDRRVRRVHRHARAWHVLAAGAAALLLVVAESAWWMFQPATALCSGPHAAKDALTVTPLEGPRAERLTSDFAPIFVFSTTRRSGRSAPIGSCH